MHHGQHREAEHRGDPEQRSEPIPAAEDADLPETETDNESQHDADSGLEGVPDQAGPERPQSESDESSQARSMVSTASELGMSLPGCPCG